MNVVNIYVVSEKTDDKKLLFEFLENQGDLLKTNYYEISLKDGEDGLEISEIKKIDNILPYLESNFKDRNIKDSKLDATLSKKVIILLLKHIKKQYSKIYNLKEEKNTHDVYNDFYKKYITYINKANFSNDKYNYKLYFDAYPIDSKSIVREDSYDDSTYYDNKRAINKYLNSRKGR